MTEEEAKTKWCPHSRYAFANGATGNRGGNQADDAYPPLASATRCQGSDCMAWRWSIRRGNLVEEKVLPAGVIPDAVDRHEWCLGAKTEKDFNNWGLFSKRGYCGLAGKP